MFSAPPVRPGLQIDQPIVDRPDRLGWPFVEDKEDDVEWCQLV